MTFIKTTIGKIGVVEELVNNEEQSQLFINIPTNISGVNVTSVSSSVDTLQTTVNTLVSGVNNISELENVDDNQYGIGFHVWVDSVRDYFRLNSGTSETNDRITVVSASSGTNQWIRKEYSDLVWKNQTQWYIDPANGNNENNGSTLGSAIETWAELIRRVGFNWDVKQHTVVWITGSISTTDPLIGYINVRNGGGLYINGIRTTRFSGTVTSKTDMDNSTNTESIVTSSWTASNEVGKLVKDTTVNRFSWVHRNEGGGVAATTAWLNIVEGFTGVSLIPSVGTINNGDTIETYDLPTVALIQLVVVGTQGGTSPFAFENIEHVSTGGGTSRFTAINSQPCFINFKSTGAIRFGAGTIHFQNCYLASTSLFIDYSAYSRIIGGVTTVSPNSSASPPSFFEIRNKAIFKATFAIRHDCRLRIDDMWFVDCSGDCIFCEHGTDIEIEQPNSSLSGKNNTGTVIALQGGSRVFYDSTFSFNITSSGGDITFAGRAHARAFDDVSGSYTESRNLTWDNIIIPVASGGFGGSVIDPVTGCTIAKEA